MNEKDGERVGQALLDALSILQERIEDPNLLAISIVLVAEDADENIVTVTHTWPPKE